MAVVNFHGCCGACIWYLGDYTSPNTVKKILETDYNASKAGWSVAVVIINEYQKSYIHQTLIDFGFVENWGQIKNRNTNKLLYGYSLDLNKKSEGTLKKITKSIFGTK